MYVYTSTFPFIVIPLAFPPFYCSLCNTGTLTLAMVYHLFPTIHQSMNQAIAQNLHHLVSTKTINGVFNLPYHHVSRRDTTTNHIPTFQGVPVEKHLTTSSKDLLR